MSYLVFFLIFKHFSNVFVNHFKFEVKFVTYNYHFKVFSALTDVAQWTGL